MATVEDFDEALRQRKAAAWQGRLIRSSRGAPFDCIANAVTALRGDPVFTDNLRFDDLFAAPFARAMPWHEDAVWREWSEVDDIELAHWCQVRGVPLKVSTCKDALLMVTTHNRHHAVREYLDGLAWDGRPRLDTLLTEYFRATDGASDTATARYIDAVSAAWPISSVARVYSPGCKADCVPILEGPQGILKSTALRTLVGPAWFADEIAELGSKDASQALRGKWVVELAELSAMRKTDVERVKAFVSRQVDHYRPSYGRRALDFPRMCTFVGTTNAREYLEDETGNRRFWPVRVTAPNPQAIARDRDQLWAEATARFKQGERWWLPQDLDATAEDEQARRRKVDGWEEPIEEWLTREKPEAPTAFDVLTRGLGKEAKDCTHFDSIRVGRCMGVLGFEPVRPRGPDKDRSRRYVRQGKQP